MSAESINRLSELTGISAPTVRHRLAALRPTDTGKPRRYESTQALPLLYGAGDDLNPTTERAALDRARRSEIELRMQEKAQTLVPLELLSTLLAAAFANVRSGLLGQHNTIAAQHPHLPDDVIESIRRHNHDLLQRLAETKFPEHIKAAVLAATDAHPAS